MGQYSIPGPKWEIVFQTHCGASMAITLHDDLRRQYGSRRCHQVSGIIVYHCRSIIGANRRQGDYEKSVDNKVRAF